MDGIITDIDAIRAANFINDAAEKFAGAKSERIQLEEFRKSKKALLINEIGKGTVQERESYAYSHNEYIALLNGIKSAVKNEEELRWRMKAAELKIEIWRTQQANIRRGS